MYGYQSKKFELWLLITFESDQLEIFDQRDFLQKFIATFINFKISNWTKNKILFFCKITFQFIFIEKIHLKKRNEHPVYESLALLTI